VATQRAAAAAKAVRAGARRCIGWRGRGTGRDMQGVMTILSLALREWTMRASGGGGGGGGGACAHQARANSTDFEEEVNRYTVEE